MSITKPKKLTLTLFIYVALVFTLTASSEAKGFQHVQHRDHVNLKRLIKKRSPLPQATATPLVPLAGAAPPPPSFSTVSASSSTVSASETTISASSSASETSQSSSVSKFYPLDFKLAHLILPPIRFRNHRAAAAASLCPTRQVQFNQLPPRPQKPARLPFRLQSNCTLAQHHPPPHSRW